MQPSIAILALLAPFAFAQYGGGSSTSSKAATTSADADSEIQTVQVGASGLVFSPSTITADEGDIIEFMIHAGHSVAESSFANPCQPIAGAGIWSGFPSSTTTFRVQVNNTNPVWLYCGVPGHCQAGMAAVINQPSGGNSLSAYQSAAKSVGSTQTPPTIQGGRFGALPASGSSASASAGSSGSTTASSSAAAATDSGNAAIGIVVNSFLAGGMMLGGAVLML